MKKIIILLILAGIFQSAFSQNTETVKSFDKEYYLKKSKTQKTTAWILLGTGTTLLAIASGGEIDFDILPTMVIGGGALIVTSIPLFIAAARNKRKAMNLAFEMQTVPRLETAGPVSQVMPSLTLKVQL